MTTREIGQLVKAHPAFQRIYGEKLQAYPDEYVADRFLEHFPQYLRLLSPHAREARRLATTPISYPTRKFFESSTTTLINQGKAIQNRSELLEMLHKADIMEHASARGLTLKAYEEITIESHKTDDIIRLKTHATDEEIRLDQHAHEQIRKQNLKNHEYIRTLNAELDELIEACDKEIHPLKKKAKETRIKHLMEELDARARQAAVQAGHRPGVGPDVPPPHGGGSDREDVQGDVESVSPPRNRVGF